MARVPVLCANEPVMTCEGGQLKTCKLPGQVRLGPAFRLSFAGGSRATATGPSGNAGPRMLARLGQLSSRPVVRAALTSCTVCEAPHYRAFREVLALAIDQSTSWSTRAGHGGRRCSLSAGAEAAPEGSEVSDPSLACSAHVGAVHKRSTSDLVRSFPAETGSWDADSRH